MGRRRQLKPEVQEGSSKDKCKKPPRRPQPLAGNKRQRKAFYARGSGTGR